MLKPRSLVPLLALLLTSTVSAQSPHALAKEEIAHLFAHLASSGCEFNRNGTWYASSRAVYHLNRKYEYLLRKGWVPDTEAFIRRAATRSSLTGEPYLVRCDDDPPLPSEAWLRAELVRYRAQRDRMKMGSDFGPPRLRDMR